MTDALKRLEDEAFPPVLAGEWPARFVRSLTAILALVHASVTAQPLSWRQRRWQVGRRRR